MSSYDNGGSSSSKGGNYVLANPKLLILFSLIIYHIIFHYAKYIYSILKGVLFIKLRHPSLWYTTLTYLISSQGFGIFSNNLYIE